MLRPLKRCEEAQGRPAESEPFAESNSGAKHIPKRSGENE